MPLSHSVFNSMCTLASKFGVHWFASPMHLVAIVKQVYLLGSLGLRKMCCTSHDKELSTRNRCKLLSVYSTGRQTWASGLHGACVLCGLQGFQNPYYCNKAIDSMDIKLSDL